MTTLADFVVWGRVKVAIHFRKKNLPYFYPRQIWWCSFGANIGFEQDGKNNKFERPVLVIKKFNKDLFLGTPLSTKIKPHNPHYYEYETQDGKKYSIITNQLRVMSSKRLLRKIGYVPNLDYRAVRESIRDYI